MKLLHTADWHLGRKLEGKERFDEQRDVLDEICAIAEGEDVDGILLAGDVYDAFNPPAEGERLYYETVARLSDGGRRAVVVIAGNHDSPDRLKASDPYGRALGVITLGFPYDIVEPFDRGSERVACLESAESFVRLRLRNGECLAVLALPYPSEARLRKVLSERIDDDDAGANYDAHLRQFMAERAEKFREGEASVVMSHLFVQGGKESESERPITVGGAQAVSPMSFPVNAGYVALGHLHRPQEFQGENGLPIRYAGSPLQYSFSEAGQEKSVTIVEFNGTRAAYRTVTLKSGRQLVKRESLKGIGELEEFLEEVDPEAWVTFKVMLEEALEIGAVDEIRRRHPRILAPIFSYVVRQDSEAEGELLSRLPLDEQFRHFVRSRGDEPTEELVRLFVELASEEEEA
ncbi:MAG: exonuclease subunit SbcD [Ignavibacteriae bacterium]|nr:exonuclease subunit SbcD [Ignavibacteriota bacterium]MCB9217484.1 exonuclease subunit SbcD [Ignavibacteria bacterium]